MKQKVLVYEPKKCIGCRLCEQICSMTHYGVSNPTKACIRIIRDHQAQMDIATYCHGCSDAPCITACNFDALSRDPNTNAILVDVDNCVACRNCIRECPYAAPSMHPNGDYVLICDLCGGQPECVNICPEKAIQYLDIEKASNLYKSVHVEDMVKKIKEGNDNE